MPDVKDHRNADGLADEALKRGVEPLALSAGTSPEAAEEMTWALYREWLNSPILAPNLPTLDEAERITLARASDHLRSYAQGLTLPEAEPEATGAESEDIAIPEADETIETSRGPSSRTAKMPSPLVPRRRRRGGRPRDTDAKQDKRIADAWQTGRFAGYDDLARELGKTKRDVRMALDRHRKRAGKTRRSKSGQVG